MESFNLPVSMLRQYFFCPRIPYFQLLIQLQAKGGPWLSQGLSFHQKAEMLTKRRNLAHYKLDNEDFRFVPDIHLFSHDLGLHGICDGAIYTKSGEIYPLEFKLSEMSVPSIGAKTQLVAYAMLLEQKENKSISRSFLLTGKKGKTFEIRCDATARTHVLQSAEKIRRSCEQALMPITSATQAQCCQCEYTNFCADRL